VKAHVKEKRTESRLTNAVKEAMERNEEKGNGGRVIRGRETKRKGGGGGRGREEEGRRGAEGGGPGREAREEQEREEGRNVGRRKGEVERAKSEASMWEGEGRESRFL